MSSLLDHPAIRSAVLPISVEQYHRLGETGIIAEQTELLEGVIVEKMIKSPQHTWIVQWLVEVLREQLPEGWHLRQEQPLTFARSEPEPDIAIVRGHENDYREQHPQTADLVVEVAANSEDMVSEDIDREKATTYANAGISEYWLVLPNRSKVEVRRQLVGGGYQSLEQFGPEDVLTAESIPDLSVSLETVLSNPKK